MLEMEIVSLIILFCLGAIFGSFACCQAWRLRYKELGKKSPGKWSVCLNCGKRLSASENIPVISWLVQKGKCKSCGAKIGKTELLSELSLGLAFAAIGAVFLPEILTVHHNVLEILMLILLAVVLLITITIMWIMMIYDAKWKLLPTKLLIMSVVFSLVYFLIKTICFTFAGNFWGDFLPVLLSTLGSVALLAGTYYLLYMFSKEKLVGSGDWLLALAVSIVLGDWWLALVTLFLSNFFASIAGLILKLKKGKKIIPFGPFLVLAFVLVYACQGWLMQLTFGMF
ncbi:prepilin peptidase [Candidatus Saccharibacteria bacterium]|nr:prepilin peptidase [Candidatus Saccharibacteria bacterium]